MVNRIRTGIQVVLSILTFAVIAVAAQAGQRWPGH